MKKITAILVIILLLVGCGKKTARDKVTMFLDQYKTLSASVIGELEKNLSEEEWSDEQKDKYRMVIKRQYKDLEYEILNERYNGNLTFIEVKVTVYDYYKASIDDEYYNIENDISYLDYKLDRMQNINDRISYNIIFNVEKDENNEYQIIDLSNTDIEKIHGIYNYDY